MLEQVSTSAPGSVIDPRDPSKSHSSKGVHAKRDSASPGDGYRADIDGLRAFAVLAVVAFHANVSALKGGFVGVDVFFVISGYLISGIILRQIAKDEFRFSDFYARRVNRILPSLLIVIVVSLAIGWVVLFPGEFRELGKHTVGGSTFSSNLILWSEAGYFDSPNKPFLHLWSLAVEEQFYLFWPLFLVIVLKVRRITYPTIVALVVASFLVNIWAVRHGQAVAAFYSPFTRFWEILAGALLSFAEIRRQSSKHSLWKRNAVRDNLFAFAGGILLCLSLAIVRSDTPWPGWHGLLPVTGTLALICAGGDTLLSRYVLSRRGVVHIGLISYPLYLWHWPLIVFTTLVNGRALSTSLASTVVVSSLILAWLTYRFIEIPIRFGRRKRRSARILLPLLGSLGVFGFTIQSGWTPSRIRGYETERYQKATKDFHYQPISGFDPATNQIAINRINGDATRTVAIVGDSHAEQYWPRIAELESRSHGTGPQILFMTYAGCPMYPGVERPGPAWHGGPFRCAEFFQDAVREIVRRRVRTVVFSSWSETLPKLYLTGDSRRIPIGQSGPRFDLVLTRFEAQMAKMTHAGVRVFIILSNPTSPSFDPNSWMQPRLPWKSSGVKVATVPRREVDSASSFVNSRLRAIANRTGATIIDPVQFLCDSSKCSTVDSKGDPIYKDGDHMRASFVRDNAGFIDQVMGR